MLFDGTSNVSKHHEVLFPNPSVFLLMSRQGEGVGFGTTRTSEALH